MTVHAWMKVSKMRVFLRSAHTSDHNILWSTYGSPWLWDLPNLRISADGMLQVMFVFWSSHP